MSDIEVAWVAGLLEGEGSFTFGPPSGRINPGCRQLRITCSMTDLDTIEKLHNVTGIGNFNPERRKYDKRRPHAKPAWVWSATRRPDVVYVLNAILPHMGERRSARIQELLDHHAEYPPLYDLEPKHGTRSRYRNRDCRCEPCVEAARKYNRELRRKQRAQAQDQAA